MTGWFWKYYLLCDKNIKKTTNIFLYFSHAYDGNPCGGLDYMLTYNQSVSTNSSDLWETKDHHGDFGEVISAEDRERIIDTQRILLIKRYEWKDMADTDHGKKSRNRRKRKLPQIPKN